MNVPQPHRLLAACRVLFDRDLETSFLSHLQKSGLRAAWRNKALQTHPDRAVGAAAKRRRTEEFIEARRAYAILLEFLDRRAPRREPTAAPRPHAASRAPHGARQQRSPAGRRGHHRPLEGLPGRRLRIGEFLYHARLIPFSVLIEALVWQRRQRDRFCEVGRRWGYLTEAEAASLLSERQPCERVGAAAQRLRLLTPVQVRTVLAFQRSRQEPLGGYFVRRGLLTPATLERVLRQCERHNAAFSRWP